eukprot:NODE_610_length_1495_cov_345.562241_g457_i0.p1 GENE.NODE_610_length_1495_cov_345.562241_g457_i0~~NODE_610_length_1495_cov_345.562241_g457_i0.p1  ORF type:complete len:403 (-),score=61.78 NODE_610_length_1495_cov_345.562241_g457_i0:221-1429(-)
MNASYNHDPEKEKKRVKEAAAKRQNFEQTQAHVGPRYTLVKPIGNGAYGFVWSAHDTSNAAAHSVRGNVAIKKVTHPFEHTIATERLLREIVLLLALDHPNILHINNLLAPGEEFTSLYIVTERMDTDLHKIIQSPQPLSDKHVQCFVYQVLRGLKYLHSANILHRDIKPSNLLLNEDCAMKICDFGLARPIPENAGVTEGTDQDLTAYVVTRWYRAPELLMQENIYTKAIDVWSVGCILAELLGRKPIFPGHDYIDQLKRITNVLGTPPPEAYAHLGSKEARGFIDRLPHRDAIPLSNLYPNASAEAIDLLTRMLAFNFHDRIETQDCLSHEYMKDLHNPADEPVADKLFIFEWEGEVLNKTQMKEAIYAQVLKFHPEMPSNYEDLKGRQESDPTATAEGA